MRGMVKCVGVLPAYFLIIPLCTHCHTSIPPTTSCSDSHTSICISHMTITSFFERNESSLPPPSPFRYFPDHSRSFPSYLIFLSRFPIHVPFLLRYPSVKMLPPSQPLWYTITQSRKPPPPPPTHFTNLQYPPPF